jgi:hypothetical protein
MIGSFLALRLTEFPSQCPWERNSRIHLEMPTVGFNDQYIGRINTLYAQVHQSFTAVK